MKKIRLLAALLVILMLPLSVMFGCNKPDEDPEDPDTGDEGGETPGGNTGGGGDQTSSVPADNDGLSGNGYLVMFNFNAAKRGNLNVDVAPYKRFFTVDASKKDTFYAVDDKAGKNGTGALLVQRTNSNDKSNFAFTTTSLGSAFGSQHTLEFDIKLGKGLLGDTLYVIADKSADQTLISIAPDGKITDCDGMLLYVADKLEGEWVHIALAVDDRARTYDVYINGVKRAETVSFSNKAYSVSEDLDQYLFWLKGETSETSCCYLDNLAFVDGIIPKEYTADDVIYRDYYTSTYDVFSASKIDANGDVLPNLDALLKTYESAVAENKGALKVNSEPYNSNSMLSMSEVLTIVKVDASGEIVDHVYTDYGVLTGLYGYGEPVGGKLFVSGEGDEAKYIDFNANKGLTFSAQNLLGDGGKVNGVYEVYGSEDAPRIKLTLDDQTVYCTITDGVLTTYRNPELTLVLATDYTSTSQAFNKVEYSYSDDDVTLAVRSDDFAGVAKLVIKDGTLDIDTAEATFEYDADEKTLTVEYDEASYIFTYNEETDTFGYSDKTLEKVAAKEFIPAEEADEYKYALKYSNFVGGYSSLTFMVDLDSFNTDEWNRFKFEYYITDDMANSSYQFMIYVDTGNHDEKGGWTYLSKVIKHSTPGWYTLDTSVDDLAANRNGEFKDFSGKVVITMSDWSNGTASNSGKASDGYSLLVKGIQFVSETAVVVGGPDAPAEGEEACEHVDEDGNSLLVPMEGEGSIVEATCTAGQVYLVKCSACNATKIDKSKPISAPAGHDYTDATVYTKEATCTFGGYTYHYCNSCGLMEKTGEIAELGHDMTESVFVISRGALVSTCRVCGHEVETPLSSTLLTFAEKIERPALKDTTNYFYVGADKYNNLLEGDYTVEAKSYIHEIIQLQCKYAEAETKELFDGLYGLRFQRKDGTSEDAYIDFLLNKQFGAGGHFVCEFDMMLGKANASGAYPTMSAGIIERETKLKSDGSGYDPVSTAVFSITNAGVICFSNDPSATIKLSADKFTNIALVFKATENVIEVYVDGYYTYSVKWGADAEYIAARSWSQLRIGCTGTVSGEQFYYFNNFAAYEGNYPICVCKDINEYTGDAPITLYDGESEATYPLVVEADKVLKLDDNMNVAKYTLEFKLTATELADGALLIGQKRDKFKMDDNVLTLLSVKEGWLYFTDTVIASLDSIADGITVKLQFDETLGGVTVYINGTLVPGGFISYPTVDDMYADAESRIRSLTFDSEVGVYTVSDLTLGVTKE